MGKEPWSQVDLIREAFHYQSRFAGSTMVFKIDFPVTEDPNFPPLMKDLALLARTGFRVLIVPGAKEWIDAVLGKYGIVSGYARPLSVAGAGGELDRAFAAPLRVTTAAAIPFVEMAAFHVATRFMTAFSGNRVDAVIGNFVRARGLGVVDGQDMEHTGAVDKIFTGALGRLLDLGMPPILPCIGHNAAGKPYNVAGDEIALAASAALGAAKLFIVSLGGGLRAGAFRLPGNLETGEQGRLVRLTPAEAEALLGTNCPGDGPGGRALRDLALALRACRAGVERVHIIDGREEGAVLRELFSNLGAGTMVYADEHEAIRPLKSADIPDVLRLMEPLMQRGVLIRRDGAAIQEKKEDYVVFEIDGSVHACGALHDWGEAQGEIAAVAAGPAYAGLGLGRRIVGCLIDRARKRGLRRVFVLTTQTQDWFESLGFREEAVESLPERRRRNYDKGRGSKVFALDLGEGRG